MSSEEIIKRILEHRRNDGSIDLNANAGSFDRGFSCDFREAESNQWQDLTFRKHGTQGYFKQVELRNFSAKSLSVEAEGLIVADADIGYLTIGYGSGQFSLSNCRIGTLHITGFKSDAEFDLELIDCDILALKFPSEISIRDIRLEGTRFSLGSANPREIRKLGEKTDSEHFPKLDRASFAFLHDWASKRGNSYVAHVARGHELAIERIFAGRTDRLFLTLWRVFSNYGLTTFRPVLWIVLAYLFVAGVFFLDGSAHATPAEGLVGWRQRLVEASGIADDIRRALVGSAESFSSPFTSFSRRALIVPESS